MIPKVDIAGCLSSIHLLFFSMTETDYCLGWLCAQLKKKIYFPPSFQFGSVMQHSLYLGFEEGFCPSGPQCP